MRRRDEKRKLQKFLWIYVNDEELENLIFLEKGEHISHMNQSSIFSDFKSLTYSGLSVETFSKHTDV